MGRDGLGQPSLITDADDRLHERHARIGERCNGGGDLQRVRPDRVETNAQELVEGGRNRQILAGRERSAAALSRWIFPSMPLT